MNYNQYNAVIKKAIALEKQHKINIDLSTVTMDAETEIYYIYMISTDFITLDKASNETNKSDFQIYMELLKQLELILNPINNN